MKFTRRDFLRYSFMATAVTALAGCGRPVEHYLLSQYPMPEYLLPGNPVYFATSRGADGFAVKCVEGRAIKVEGLPGHPVNRGKLNIEAQVAIQNHYHPERLTQPLKGGKSVTWDVSQDDLKGAFAQSGGLFIVDKLSGSKGSFMLAMAKAIGASVWVLQYPSNETERRVLKGITGKAELPYYPIEQADYILNFGNDFLHTGPLSLRYGWAYGEFRQGKDRQRGVLVSVGSRMDLSSANSDRWLPCRPGSEGMVAAALGSKIGASRSGWSGGNVTMEQAHQASGIPVDLLERLAARLQKARKPLVIAGPDGSFDAPALAAMHNLNRLLTGSNPTYEVDLLPSLAGQAPDPGVVISTEQALAGFDSNRWQSVWVFDCNPVYLLPASFKIADKIKSAKSKIAFSLFANETTALCDLVLPSRTYLEEWGDCLVDAPFAQVYNLAQPVVKPRSDTRSVTDSLLQAARAANVNLPFPKTAQSFRDLLRQGLGERWEAAVVRGGIWSAAKSTEAYHHAVSNPPPSTSNPGGDVPSGVNAWSGLEAASGGSPTAPQATSQGKAVLIPFANQMGDGAMANSPWMQELPDPMTTVAWASWIEINPFSDLAKAGVKRGDLLEISTDSGLKIMGPAYPTQAVQVNAIAIPVGNGHANGAYGRYSDQVATPLNPLALCTGIPSNPWAATQVTVNNTRKVQFIATFDRRIMGLEKHTLPH